MTSTSDPRGHLHLGATAAAHATSGGGVAAATAESSELARVVRRGLACSHKWLPSHLLYDARGSALYEEITELPEYYLTRAERAIFAAHSPEIVALAARGAPHPLRVIELGAGSASKTRLVLEAVVARQGRCVYMPIDISGTALARARALIQAELPGVEVRPFVGRHEAAFPEIALLGPRRLVLFIGSSIGNYDDDSAVALLAGLRRGLGRDGALLLGTDLLKSPELVLPAYADAAGVTARFNSNVLVRINRELAADFDLDQFRHVARWNHAASQVEMHLESLRDQTVHIAALGLTVRFAAGETIHTESSIKYDLARVDRILGASGFARTRSFTDPQEFFAVHLAHVAASS